MDWEAVERDRKRQVRLTRILRTQGNHAQKALSANLRSYFALLGNLAKEHPRLSFTPTLDQLKEVIRDVYSRRQTIISMDIEAHEHDSKKITEIGISIYDPSVQVLSMTPNIKQLHLVVNEYRDLYNGKYVADNKDKFLGGPSMLMDLNECREIIQEIIDYYGITLPDEDCEIDGCYFVGHGYSEDIQWLKQLGIIFPQKMSFLDTQNIWRISHGNQGNSLTRILRYMDIPHAYLHNAGNDAYYTLQLALALCDPQIRTLKRLDEVPDSDTLMACYEFKGKPMNLKSRKKPMSFEICERINHLDVSGCLCYFFDNECRELL